MTILQATELTHAAMLGLGVYRPARVVTNDEICEVLDSSDEWIQCRRRARPGGGRLIAFGAGLSFAGQVVTLPPDE